MANNVIEFPRTPALFSNNVRKQVSHGISDLTDKPDETTDRVEQILCTAIVAFARKLGTQLGSKLGEKSGKAVARIGK